MALACLDWSSGMSLPLPFLEGQRAATQVAGVHPHTHSWCRVMCEFRAAMADANGADLSGLELWHVSSSSIS